MNNKCKNFNYSRIFPIFADKIQLIIYLKTCNNMKSIIRKFVGAALLLALPLSFTSCDDILGPWEKSNPSTPLPSTPEITLFKSILDTGSTLTAKFTIGGENYSVTFKKVGDKYTVQSDNPIDEKLYSFEYDETNKLLVLTKKYDPDESGKYVPQAQLFFDPETDEYYIINAPGFDTTFDGSVTVKKTIISLTNACPDKTVVDVYGWSDYDKQFAYPYWTLTINYNKAKGDTWHNAVDRYKKSKELKTMLVILDSDNEPIIDAGSTEGPVANMKQEGTTTYRCIVSYTFDSAVAPSDTNDKFINSADKIGMNGSAAFAGPYKAKAWDLSAAPKG